MLIISGKTVIMSGL